MDGPEKVIDELTRQLGRDGVMTMRAAMRWVGALYGALALSAVLSSVSAQSVQGTLLRADSVPAGGVIVVASRGERDSVVARTMTNGNGRYALEVPAGAVRLRALRIGHKPVLIAEFTLGAGARRETKTVLPDDPIVLQAVTTEASSSCRQSGAAGANVATVFEEARKALLSTTLKSRDPDPLARLSLYEQVRSVGNRELSPLDIAFQEGVSLKPFQSLPPDSLAKVGYMQNDLGGATYWAPDADVLLSETFASSHCLSVVDGKAEHAGWIGLAFRPQEFRRNFVDVSGTLWLDRATSELRRMDYRYEGLPINMQRVEPGGDVEFTRLADGTWFVNKWEIRMPRMSAPPGSPRLMGTYVKGGEVWRMRRGSELVFTNGRDEPAPRAVAKTEAEAPTPEAAGGCVTATGEPAGVLTGTVLDERGAPLADVVVTVEWQDNHSAVGRQLAWETKRLSTTTGRDGAFSACGVARGRLASVIAMYGTRRSAKVAVRIADGDAPSRVDLKLGGVRAAEGAGKGVAVRLRDAMQNPIAHALVEVEGGRGRITDDSGRMVLDAAPDSLRILARRIGYSPFDGRIAKGKSGEFEVTLRPLAQTLAAVTVTERGNRSPLERSGFYDRMLQAQRGAYNADFVTPEELDARAGVRATDLFQGRRFAFPQRTPGNRPQTYLMGRGGCKMSVFLDGRLLVPEGGGRARSDGIVALDEIVGASEISGIEIYASAANAPAALIPLAGAAQSGACGIVAIWTGGRH